MPSIEKIGCLMNWSNDFECDCNWDNSMDTGNTHFLLLLLTLRQCIILYLISMETPSSKNASDTSSSDKYHICCINLTIAALANGKSDDLYSIMELINSRSFLVADIARGDKNYAFT